jgi:hypothetical protein
MITESKLRRNNPGALAILAAVIEHRGYIRSREITLRVDGPLPKILYRVYGGGFDKSTGTARFRLRGKHAVELLQKLIPLFMSERKQQEARKALKPRV